MGKYDFQSIESKWQEIWEKNQTYLTIEDPKKPKCYVLDMFPYPSGSGLHVGHPLGYIATDIYARYKKMKGFNVLHPMGFDAFGLPAETYAIETGIHPKISTQNNIQRYKKQLKRLGIAYDWSREIVTCEPDYYRWTQWIFLKLFDSWFDKTAQKSKPIKTLVDIFEKEGNFHLQAACDEDTPKFDAKEWKQFSEQEKQRILLKYRLAYLDEMYVNWCPNLGCVLANDEVINGVSERGGHPVERKLMKQWALRISAYSERLLNGLENLDWSESIKEQQKNWIGRSVGVELDFYLQNFGKKIKVFTTRIDTIFGVSFIAIAPENQELISLVPQEFQQSVQSFLERVKQKSEKERISELKTMNGVFTGLYAVHPFSKKTIPVWIADYVLIGYGTGAVMGVPSSDERDFRFAKQYHLPIIRIFEGTEEMENPTQKTHGILCNSDFLNGKTSEEALNYLYEEVERLGIGVKKVNYRMRDAIFARQRYWGEPIPIYYKDGLPYPLKESELPLVLPEIDKYLPTESGEPPLARANNWVNAEGYPLETNTMPGWAGSSWYFLRFMSPKENQSFVNPEAEKYWNSVDLYVGGTEHAVGHLLYARFWNMVLYDLGYLSSPEPFKKLVNQGMIQGRSSIVYRKNGSNLFISKNLIKNFEDVTPIRVDVSFVDNDILSIEKFKNWRPEYENATFELENGQYVCGSEIEKMSKRWHNVVNPDDMCEKYGADTFRMYEMFLGPIEQHKPWNTAGITGVHSFLKKLHNLFVNEKEEWIVTDTEPTKEELKVLHQTIKKIEEDCEKLSFNTAVAQFMICVNELTKLKCHKKVILSDLLILLSPFAPHICEELWFRLGNNQSITQVKFPAFNPEYLVEECFEYPISINGKLKSKLEIPLNLDVKATEKLVLENEKILNLIGNKEVKKVIVVHGKIVNIVI